MSEYFKRNWWLDGSYCRVWFYNSDKKIKLKQEGKQRKIPTSASVCIWSLWINSEWVKLMSLRASSFEGFSLDTEQKSNLKLRVSQNEVGQFIRLYKWRWPLCFQVEEMVIVEMRSWGESEEWTRSNKIEEMMCSGQKRLPIMGKYRQAIHHPWEGCWWSVGTSEQREGTDS